MSNYFADSPLAREVETLQANGWEREALVTIVDAKSVAESGLVKNTLVLGGYQTPMEETVSALLADFAEAEKDAKSYGLQGLPKAIYVCNTNIVAGNANEQDDPKQVFTSRQAPPIRIWRYLVEACGVKPDEIAVYCSLKFDKNFPPPSNFHLFKGGDDDFKEFSAGGYRHIIFNLSLQEGWDDPLCYFAYVDKSMESRVQVEQIVGRLLRQPGARHYSSERLNTAHFYLRVDRNQVFADILSTVTRKLTNDAPNLRVIASPPGKKSPVEYHPKKKMTIPGTALNPEEAVEPISNLIKSLSNYQQDDGTNTQGVGSRAKVLRRLGETDPVDAEWETFKQSSKVLARWIFQREIRKRYPGVLGVAPTADPKFDAEIGLGSNAEAHVVNVAEQVVLAFIDNVHIRQKSRDPYVVGTLLARPDEIVKFRHALHQGYDRLNSLELAFAQALDKHGAPWCRNPARTGYGIPLPSPGTTATFYPDFVVWDGDDVFVIDTKGAHILAEAVARKLLWIDAPRNSTTRLFVRLVSEGTWSASAEQTSADGFTVWGMKPGGERTAKHYDSLEKVVKAVLTPKRA
jgi:type III restriction enzyme